LNILVSKYGKIEIAKKFKNEAFLSIEIISSAFEQNKTEKGRQRRKE
jgi:hypothetical protein